MESQIIKPAFNHYQKLTDRGDNGGMVHLLPLPAHRARLVRLLVSVSVVYAIAGTGLLLSHWLPPFWVSEMLGSWLLFIALPVSALLGLLWAFTVPKVQT